METKSVNQPHANQPSQFKNLIFGLLTKVSYSDPEILCKSFRTIKENISNL